MKERIAQIQFEEVDALSICSPGTYKVALVIDNGYDYHWYRQNPDGTWSHKRGDTAVTDVDASNRIIWNPDTANKYYTEGANYIDAIRFYQVTAVNAMYDYEEN